MKKQKLSQEEDRMTTENRGKLIKAAEKAGGSLEHVDIPGWRPASLLRSGYTTPGAPKSSSSKRYEKFGRTIKMAIQTRFFGASPPVTLCNCLLRLS